MSQAVWHRRLSRRTGFHPRPVYVGFW